MIDFQGLASICERLRWIVSIILNLWTSMSLLMWYTLVRLWPQVRFLLASESGLDDVAELDEAELADSPPLIRSLHDDLDGMLTLVLSFWHCSLILILLYSSFMSVKSLDGLDFWGGSGSLGRAFTSFTDWFIFAKMLLQSDESSFSSSFCIFSTLASWWVCFDWESWLLRCFSGIFWDLLNE